MFYSTFENLKCIISFQSQNVLIQSFCLTFFVSVFITKQNVNRRSVLEIICETHAKPKVSINRLKKNISLKGNLVSRVWTKNQFCAWFSVNPVKQDFFTWRSSLGYYFDQNPGRNCWTKSKLLPKSDICQNATIKRPTKGKILAY